jgi:hypothetical protein
MKSEKWLEVMLNTISIQKLGPTYTSRFLYLGSTIILYVISQAAGRRKTHITEIELQKRYRICDDSVDKIILEAFKILYTLLNYPLTQLPKEEGDLPWNSRDKKVLNALKLFLENRDNDGWKTANIFPGSLPNGQQYIKVDEIQDLSTLPEPTKWTPLVHGNSSNPQKYLTPLWGTLKTIVEPQKYIDLCNENFHINREEEMEEILRIYETMTDKQRVIAEYFQGGKVTPPGIWNVWSIYAAKAYDLSDYKFAKLLYYLNSTLFMSSIIAWNAKFSQLESRPIQYIRLLPERIVTTWDGTKVSNRIWKPFQQNNAITPPFPDFISGHSTFSGSASVIFEKFFSDDFSDVKFSPFSQKHADMISPMIANNLNQCTISNISCLAGSSSIGQGNSPLPFPLSVTCLNFSGWRELAELSGNSRIYGGIHTQAANGIGILCGQMIASDIIKQKTGRKW